MVKELKKDHEKDVEYVYSAYITLRNGKRLIAKDCGLNAFRFPAKRK